MSLALYRRYRPETFAELIGQEHVTVPLQQALRSDRVNHAYLFSGPRGCGKTTSARILARCLNCEQGPTDTPCGTCQSCTDLARGGPGSLDVIEIDAASHGGVDDARDLRERAFFAPASSRYKIYIVDEAHMVSTQGFNALLKLVEEPPEHVKFIFATTEPDKVIGTIRSRTHHYPFRLVPPAVLLAYLGKLCDEEGVKVDPTALPLVVRAGEGSVRDSLSVLDQLIAGADEGGVTYATAVGLLGYTDSALLASVVDALAAGDGAAAFASVDRVIEGGLEPRRFVGDLLEHFRDLIMLSAVPDAAAQGLVTGPADQLEAMSAQAAQFGRAELVRGAEILSVGLTEMRGATAPRLQLELLMARMLLPGADDSTLGVAARIDTVERRLAIGGAPASAADAPLPAAGAPTGVAGMAAAGAAAARAAVSGTSAPAAASASAPPAAAASANADDRPDDVGNASAESSAGTAPATAPPTAPAAPTRAEEPAAPVEPSVDVPPTRTPAPATEPAAPAAAAPAPVAATPPAAGGSIDVVEVRRMWPTVLEAVRAKKRVTWMLLFEKTTVLSVSDATLALAFDHAGSAKGFTAGGHDEVLRAALKDTLGVDWRVEALVDPGRAAAPTPATPQTQQAPPPPPSQPRADQGASTSSSATSPTDSDATPATTSTPPRSSPDRAVRPAAPEPERADERRVSPENDVATDDDHEAPDQGLSAEELIARQLGGVRIDPPR